VMGEGPEEFTMDTGTGCAAGDDGDDDEEYDRLFMEVLGAGMVGREVQQQQQQQQQREEGNWSGGQLPHQNQDRDQEMNDLEPGSSMDLS
jgi:hypothetical protein